MNVDVANALVEKRHLLGEWVTREFFEKRPAFKEKWGAHGMKRCSEDSAFHFSYLAESIRFQFPILFTDYLAWTKALLAALGMPEEDLRENLNLMQAGVAAHLSPEHAEIASRSIEHGIAALPELKSSLDSHFKENAPFVEVAQKWLELLLRHQPREARRLILDTIKSGAKTIDIYQHVFTPALYEVGRLWQMRKINEAEEHYCSQATQTLLAVLSLEFPPIRIGKSVVGFSVGNEMHEIGIRLVTDCFAHHGWDAVCLGSNVPTRNIDSILRTWAPDVIAISATMTYHLAEMQAVVTAIKSAKVAHPPKVLVGGRPFRLCPELRSRLGADGAAHSCPELIAESVRIFQ